MNNLIKIENQELQIKEYQGKRVVTLKDVDRVHETSSGVARQNFNRNKNHFIEDVDFFSVTRKDFAELYEQNNCVTDCNASQKMKGNPNVSMVLTETGYLMVVKSLTDDLAWKVQRQLVDCYFKVKEVGEKLSPNENEQVTQKEWIQFFTSITKLPKNERNLSYKLIGLNLEEEKQKQLVGSKVVTNDKAFQDELNRYLKENKLSLKKMSEETGIPKSNLSYWKNGKSTPSIDNLEIVVKIIGGNVEDYI